MAPSMRPKRKTPADAQFLTGDDYAEAHDLSERDALTQEELGRIGGRCAGRIGENRYVAGVVKDSRSRCQFRCCARRCLVPGDSRLGKRPPSLRHGTSLKTTWYHLPCAFAAFRGCARKSKVVTALADIEEGLDELPAEDRALVAALIDEFNDDRAREEAARAAIAHDDRRAPRPRRESRWARPAVVSFDGSTDGEWSVYSSASKPHPCTVSLALPSRSLLDAPPPPVVVPRKAPPLVPGPRSASLDADVALEALDNDRFLASPGHSPRGAAPPPPLQLETDDDDDVADFDFFDGFDFDEAFGPGFEEPPKPSFLAKRLLDDPETDAVFALCAPIDGDWPLPLDLAASA
ncbi:N-acylsphingosine amidohydrolase [Aureococcus anophagefferens]|nr:N-acylsphingosine amidohydrolase [Aureococcus anophagefferens]